MSWQDYVDTNLVKTGQVAQACIISHAGDVWATSSGFDLSDPERKHIAEAYASAETLDKFRAEGVTLAGQKYFTLRAEERTVFGKLGSGGFCLVKTKQAIIITTFAPTPELPMTAEKSTGVVEDLADYLITCGY